MQDLKSDDDKVVNVVKSGYTNILKQCTDASFELFNSFQLL